jgi:hypothetical protein
MATHGRPGASGSCVLPTSHARSDAGHRCPVELTVAARGLRTRLWKKLGSDSPSATSRY